MSEPTEIAITLRASGLARPVGLEPDTLDWTTGACPHCNRDLEDSAPIVNHNGHGWLHLGCLADRIKAMEPDAAWLTLAEQIARNPSRYRAAEIRAVVQNVIRIAKRKDGAT